MIIDKEKYPRYEHLSSRIKRLDWMPLPGDIITHCRYIYEFNNSQFLESIDEQPWKYFGIDHDSIKQIVIHNLVEEFRISLNQVVYGDPAGKIENNRYENKQ